MKSLLFLAILSIAKLANAEAPAWDGVRLMDRLPNGNILLGAAYLDEADTTEGDSDNDTFALPDCDGRSAILVESLSLQATRVKPNGVKNLDAWLKKVVVVFGNGDAVIKTFDRVEGWLKVSEESGESKAIHFGRPRCLRSVSVIGEQYEGGLSRAPSYVRVVGVTPK